MAYQKNAPGVLVPISFNFSSSSENTTIQENSCLNAQQDPLPKTTGEEFKVPQYRYPQQLFIKQPNSQKYVRRSILPKVVMANKRSLLSNTSTPKVYSKVALCNDLSPINQIKEIDELPSAKRFKTSDFRKIPMVELKSAELVTAHNYNHPKNNEEPPDDNSVSSTTETYMSPRKVLSNKDKFAKLRLSDNKTSQILKENVSTRKFKNVANTESHFDIDIRKEHDLVNSRNLSVEGAHMLPNKLSARDHFGGSVLSPMPDTSMPSAKDKKAKEIMNAFDRAVGMSASVILISSAECSSSSRNQVSYVEGFSKPEKEVSKKNISVNTTKGITNTKKSLKTPTVTREVTKPNTNANKSLNMSTKAMKTSKLVTRATQKNALKDISTNTSAPFKNNSTKIDETLTEESEKSRKSIGTNTSLERVVKKGRPRKTKQTSLWDAGNITEKVVDGTSDQYNISKQSLRRQTKTVDYSYGNTSLSNTNETSNNTRASQVAKKHKKRKTHNIPNGLRVSVKPKPKQERLSGFYEMEAKENENGESSTSTQKRRGRPTSLYIQSHLVGPGSLKKKLLKKVATRRSSLLIQQSLTNNASTTRKSKKQTLSSTTDDTAFKKPYPVKNSRSRSSTTNSSISTVGGDREPLFSSPLIETISEDPDDEYMDRSIDRTSTNPVDHSRERSHTNKQTVLAEVSTNSPVRPKKSSLTNSSIELSARGNRNKPNSLSEIKITSMDTGIGSSSKQSVQVDVHYSEKSLPDLPLDDAIYEIEDSSHEHLSQKKNSSPKKSMEKEYANKNLSYLEANAQEKDWKSKTRNTSETIASATDCVLAKPRKSVTFCETVKEKLQGELQRTRRSIPLGNEDCNDNLAVAISDKAVQQRATSEDSDIEGSDNESDNAGAICTLINNQTVLLRKWNSDMPDVSSGSDSLVNYTMKNVLCPGMTISSGCLTFEPGQKKSTSYALKCNLFFNVMTGNGIVTVQSKKINVKAGSHFIIPLASSYSIKNARSDSVLTLFFIKFKTPT